MSHESKIIFYQYPTCDELEISSFGEQMFLMKRFCNIKWSSLILLDQKKGNSNIDCYCTMNTVRCIAIF